MSTFLRGMLMIYAVVLTAAFAGLVFLSTGGTLKLSDINKSEETQQPTAAKFTEIDVERINIREPDGTIRIALYNRARKPGIIVKNKMQPHPNRDMAGMIFYNDEGTEMGGLVFSGMETEDGVINGGSLTFDRYEQDQIVQLMGIEQGDRIVAGLAVGDVPEKRMDFEAMEQWRVAEPGPEKDALFEKVNLGGAPRAFFGRGSDKSSQALLRDGQGRKRLEMRVSEAGETEILFYDEAGEVVKRISAED